MLIRNFATAFLALVFGFLGAALWSYSGLADNRTREFLLANPQMLPEMVEAFRSKEAAESLAEVRDEVLAPFPGAFLGNPNGTKILVEFTDYNCPYCEASLADVTRLVAEDPDLKVVVREWSIFDGSEIAARMALAAAMQGRYAEFHEKMFELGPATPETVEAAAQAAGLDVEKAKQDAVSQNVTVELARNQSLAQALGFSGTPAWVTGDTVLDGAVGFDRLREAVNEAGQDS